MSIINLSEMRDEFAERYVEYSAPELNKIFMKQDFKSGFDKCAEIMSEKVKELEERAVTDLQLIQQNCFAMADAIRKIDQLQAEVTRLKDESKRTLTAIVNHCTPEQINKITAEALSEPLQEEG